MGGWFVVTGLLVMVCTPIALADTPSPPPSRISGDAGVTFTTQYVWHGILQENQGFIAQPYADLQLSLYESDAAVSKIALFTGIWNSLQSQDTGAAPGESLANWYEFDWDVGISIDFLQKWNLCLTYVEFTSPSNAFASSKNVQARLAYDDSDHHLSLMPYATIFAETDGKAGTGPNLGYYLELGIGPTLALNDPKSPCPLTLRFPAAVGLGFDGFYGDASGDNQTFGYASAGVELCLPLKFLSERGYGGWSLTAGVYEYYFGPGVRDANKAAGTGAAFDTVASLTMAVTF